ncbi:hypothetical protein ES703_52568 [subsurface metagenome]
MSLLFLVSRVPYLNDAGKGRGKVFFGIGLEPGCFDNTAAFGLRLAAVLGRPPKGASGHSGTLQGGFVVSCGPKGFPWFPTQDVPFFRQSRKVDYFPGVGGDVFFDKRFLAFFFVLGRVSQQGPRQVLFVPAGHNHDN